MLLLFIIIYTRSAWFLDGNTSTCFTVLLHEFDFVENWMWLN